VRGVTCDPADKDKAKREQGSPFVGRATCLAVVGGIRVACYSPRYCRLRESALAAWSGVKLSMQASSE
jgi:hypothetical protein